ncbi:MAG TPA: hypothetical protein PKE20_10555 [Promineifilum sp.]|nr:hypothetical protein [Promineifilum sp.]
MALTLEQIAAVIADVDGFDFIGVKAFVHCGIHVLVGFDKQVARCLVGK